MLEAYRRRNWPEARESLARCRNDAPDLLKTFFDLYEERINDNEADPPPDDWDGVYVALTK
ncbi:hypothetical protein MCP1_400001 [Candidatus Terasakiella magnetica]|nr:hypothetical protein MCP1_400001 [Candidatus Terasakiella magnetica]